MGRGLLVLLFTGGLLVLASAALLIAGTSPAAAESPERPRVLNWSPGRITGTVNLGATITRTVNLTVSQPITNPKAVVRPKKFQENVTVSGLLGTLQPGTTYQVTVTATVPEKLRGRAFNFDVFLRADDEEGVFGPPLKLRFKLEHPAKPHRVARPGK